MPVLADTCTAAPDCSVDVDFGSATATSTGPGTATVDTGEPGGAPFSTLTASTDGTGTARSSSVAGSASNTVSSTTVGSGSATANVNGLSNDAKAISGSGGTAIAGVLSSALPAANFNSDYAEANNGGRAVAGQNVLRVQSGEANDANINKAFADGAGARASAGQLGFGNMDNKTVASAVGAGSVAQAVSGSDLPTSLSSTVAPGPGLARVLPAAAAFQTEASAQATGGGDARAQTWGLKTVALSQADGAGSKAVSLASGGSSRALSEAANGGKATAISSGAGFAGASATRTGGSTAIANAAGNQIDPDGGVIATAISSDTERVATVNGLTGTGSCAVGAHGYAFISDKAGTKSANC